MFQMYNKIGKHWLKTGETHSGKEGLQGFSPQSMQVVIYREKMRSWIKSISAHHGLPMSVYLEMKT